MARESNAAAIYEAADLFRTRCLKSGLSLLWPESHAWTIDNTNRLYGAFMANPDESDQRFYDKWKAQLVDQPLDVHRIAADVVALYYLFPSKTRKETKLAKVREVMAWKLSSDIPDLSFVERAYDSEFEPP